MCCCGYLHTEGKKNLVWVTRAWLYQLTCDAALHQHRWRICSKFKLILWGQNLRLRPLTLCPLQLSLDWWSLWMRKAAYHPWAVFSRLFITFSAVFRGLHKWDPGWFFFLILWTEFFGHVFWCMFGSFGVCVCVCREKVRLPCWLSGKESACQCKRHSFDPWVGKIPWRRAWHPAQCSSLKNPVDREPGGLQSTGSQRAGHDWVTEQKQRKVTRKIDTWALGWLFSFFLSILFLSFFLLLKTFTARREHLPWRPTEKQRLSTQPREQGPKLTSWLCCATLGQLLSLSGLTSVKWES